MFRDTSSYVGCKLLFFEFPPLIYARIGAARPIFYLTSYFVLEEPNLIVELPSFADLEAFESWTKLSSGFWLYSTFLFSLLRTSKYFFIRSLAATLMLLVALRESLSLHVVLSNDSFCTALFWGPTIFTETCFERFLSVNSKVFEFESVYATLMLFTCVVLEGLASPHSFFNFGFL